MEEKVEQEEEALCVIIDSGSDNVRARFKSQMKEMQWDSKSRPKHTDSCECASLLLTGSMEF